MAACVQACEEVHDACEHAVQDTHKKSTVYSDVHHIGILLDCAQMARTARDFVLRQSEMHDVTCHACAEICLACARKCYALGESRLVELCHHCASLCRNPHGVAAESGEAIRHVVA